MNQCRLLLGLVRKKSHLHLSLVVARIVVNLSQTGCCRLPVSVVHKKSHLHLRLDFAQGDANSLQEN
jgi:hypothetical protein